MKVIIVLPIYNEEIILKHSLNKIYFFCKKNLQHIDWEIIIADNGSTDNSEAISKSQIKKLNNLKYFKINQMGKGLAIKKAWTIYDADFYCFMDIDISTDLYALLDLLNWLKKGYNIVIGNRFDSKSKTKRNFLRIFISVVYNYLTKTILRLKIDDAQCGFKAIDNITKNHLLPLVKDNGFFFDTELLYLAQIKKYKIKQIPIIWKEKAYKKRKSKVKIIFLSFKYIKKLIKLKKRKF